MSLGLSLSWITFMGTIIRLLSWQRPLPMQEVGTSAIGTSAIGAPADGAELSA